MIDEQIKAAMASALAGDGMADVINKHCREAINSVIQRAFGYGSDFRKQLKAKVDEVMPTVNADELAAFTHAVRHVVQDKLVTLADEQAAKTVAEMMEQLLPDSKIIMLVDFKKAFLDKVFEDDEHDDYESDFFDEQYHWEVEQSSRLLDGYFDITCSPDSGDGRHSAGTTTLRFRTGDDGLASCWYCRMGGVEVDAKRPFVGPLYGFDAMVFRLYTGVAKLGGVE